MQKIMKYKTKEKLENLKANTRKNANNARKRIKKERQAESNRRRKKFGLEIFHFFVSKYQY